MFFNTAKKTILHNIDPRIKLFTLGLLFLIITFLKNLPQMLILLTALVILFLLAKSGENIKKMGKVFFLIGLMTFFLWAIFNQGEDRFISAGLMTLRFTAYLLAGLFFLSITSLEEFSTGLILWGIPYPVAFTVSLSFRLVAVFTSTGFTIVEAQKVRGNNVEEGNIGKRIKAYVPLLVPLILNGIKKAETLTLALESKGFSPTNKIKVRDRYKLRIFDWIILLLGLVITGFVISLTVLS